MRAVEDRPATDAALDAPARRGVQTQLPGEAHRGGWREKQPPTGLWQTVEGGIEEAEQARADVLSRKRKGGKVAPTKQTFEDAGNAWLERQVGVRPRTVESYSWALRVHLIPWFGRKQVASIGEDDVAGFIAAKQKAGLSGHSIRGMLKPLRGVLNYAAR